MKKLYGAAAKAHAKKAKKKHHHHAKKAKAPKKKHHAKKPHKMSERTKLELRWLHAHRKGGKHARDAAAALDDYNRSHKKRRR